MADNGLIYLDYNATAPIRSEVIKLMTKVMEEGGNPSSVHAFGRKAKARLEAARAQIAMQVNCRAQMIVFTSGGTEANNMAILSSGRSRLITTNAEHDSVGALAARFDGDVEILRVNEHGLVNASELEQYMQNNGEGAVVSILYANNETGVLQDIEQIVKIAHDAGALVHIDAIQALGKIPIDFMAMKVDMMSLSSHKIGGPQGIGALVVHEKLPIKSLIVGGGQEIGRRGGTENIAGIAGFGEAASMIPGSIEKMEEVGVWRDEIEAKIAARTSDADFLGKNTKRLPNVSTIYMPDVKSETQVMNFDLDKICISSGSACSSGKVKSSHVIEAMTNNENIASSTIRMSMGWNTTKSEADAFAQSWIRQYDKKHS